MSRNAERSNLPAPPCVLDYLEFSARAATLGAIGNPQLRGQTTVAGLRLVKTWS